MLKFSARILKSRLALAEMTTADLARKMKVTRAAVCLWCSGSGTPKMTHILSISSILQCQIGDLLEEKGAKLGRKKNLKKEKNA